MSVINAIHDTVLKYGVEEMSVRLQRNRNTVQHMANPNNETHHFSPLEPVTIQAASKDYSISHASAAALGGVFVEPADMAHICDQALLDMFLTMSTRVGKFASDFQTAWSDGRLNANEFEGIKADLYQIKQIAGELEMRMEPMVEQGRAAR